MPVNLGWCSEANEKIKYYKERKCKIRFTAGSKTREITIVKKSHIATTRGNNPCYQWGRKDPFIAAIGDNFANKPRWNYIGYQDTNNPPRLTDDSYGSDDTKRMTTREALHLLIQKPDTWHNPPRTETGDNDIPYVSNNKTYANLWEGRPGTDPNATILKTIYDPCPVGYQVSHYNAFTGFTTTGNNSSYWPQWFDVQIQNIADYNPTTGACGELGEYSNNLYEFYTNSGKYQSIIFPLTGYRDWDAQANTYHFNKIGYIWAAGNVKNDDNNSYNFEFARDDGGNKENVDHSYVRPKNTFFPCDGFPIRPCRNGKHGLVL